MDQKVKDPKRVKAGRMAKNKGKRFELEATKLLSELIFNDPDVLRRTPRSGAALIFGDCYYPPAPHDIPLVFEFKNEESFDLHHIFSEDSSIWKWWEQVNHDVSECIKLTGKVRVPVLIFTKNWYPIFILSEMELLHYISFKKRLIFENSENRFVIGILSKENVTWLNQEISNRHVKQ